MVRKDRAQRGMALLVAMLAVLVMSVIVAGALVFTGTERTSAVMQTRDDQLSACAQAARNMFLSRIRVLSGNATGITFNEAFADSAGERRIRSGHYTPPAGGPPPEIVDVVALDGEVMGGGSAVHDLSNGMSAAAGDPSQGGGGSSSAGGTLAATAYRVNVVCQSEAGGPEREIEFVVKVGL